jgi:hypothetical protein
MAGVVDSAFYSSLRRFLATTHAPALVRESIDFMHGLAAWDYAEASHASDPLLRARGERGALARSRHAARWRGDGEVDHR